MSKYLAIDFGAESGRGVVVTLENGTAEMEEIHRFPNRPVRMAGTMYWDFPFLFAETLETMKRCAELGIELDAIGVDTWGVDFGLLGEDGQLLANPVHYRDSRTENIHAYSEPIMSNDDIFALTALEPWTISSLFQVLALQRDKSPILPLAKTLLNMPDLFNYFLTGRKASEKSIVNTGNLLGIDKEWCREIFEKFGLPDMFHDLVEPGTVLGPLSEEVQAKTGLGAVPVVAVCGHDTASVAASVPAEGDNWAFLSSGTWSIISRVIDEPVNKPECLELGFTNEYTLGAWFVARNILGLWLIQELKRKWDTGADAWDYNRITKEAGKAKSGPLFYVSDPSLLAPADMEDAIVSLIEQSGEHRPANRGELLRSVHESLALEYACRLEDLSGLTEGVIERLYIVGGGTANKLLCQLTANACGISTFAGADQCTALGNALTQAVAMDDLEGPQDIRDVMRRSFPLTSYAPEGAEAWVVKMERYKKIRNLSQKG